MKKHLVILMSLFSSVTLFSQVGINTQSPKATLDVVASPGDNTKTDGILIPRLTGAELKAKDALYTAAQKGTIIYATSASSSAGIAGQKTINIDVEGFYYFDGVVWKKISTETGIDTSIYTHNGTLTANRIVTMDGKNLSFSGNGNVGIGTAVPASKLHVVSSNNYGAFQMQDGSQSEGKFLASDTFGKATWVNSPLTPVVFAALDTSSTEFDLGANQYVGDKITLTKGRWLVYVGKLLNPSSNPSSSNNAWVRLTLSSSQTSQQTSGFSFLSSSLVSGWLESVSAANTRYTFLSGVIAINVTSNSLTLYLRTREFSTIGTSPVVRTRGNFGENYLFATPTY